MKTILVHLRLATASHRKRLLGIFSHFGSASGWQIRLVPDEAQLCAMMQGVESGVRPDGIISGIPYASRTLDLISALGIPFVGIGMTGRELAVTPRASAFVMNDNEGIGAAAADYFMQLGDFRTYAFVADTGARSWSKSREAGFASRLADKGKRCRVFAAADDAKDNARLADFIAALPKPAAVLAAWDGRGADVLDAARCRRLRVPEELAVLGVDDDTLVCEHTLPMLSSVRTNAESMGAAAAKLMEGLLSARRKNAAAATVTCPILGIVERGSTHAPAPAADLIRRAKAFIAQEAAKGIRAEDVARHLKISRRLLDLRFGQFEPFSVSETIALRRLDEVRRLLKETAKPVREVFRLAGFHDIASAHRLFKESTGASPNVWRKANHVAEPKRPGSKEPQFETLAEITASDAKALRRLVAQLDPSATFDPAKVNAALRSGVTTLYAVRLRGKLVGAAASARFATPTGTHHRIEDVVVDASARGMHIGRTLMEYVLADIRSKGAKAIELTSRPSRVAANALYRSIGFTQKTTNVYTYAVNG